MRILLINTTEKIGGPAVAASRLMEALKNNGIKAKLLVRDKQTEQITVVELPHNLRMVWKFVWERIVIWKANHFNRNHLFAVDIANAGTDITNLPEFQQADIIHLHYSGGCTHYEEECHHCPFIHNGSRKKDLSHRIFLKKQKLYEGRHINFVACSHWLEERARKSALFSGHAITSIPNPINTNLFKPHSKKAAREKCRLPQDSKLVLFGSVKIMDTRKGVEYMIKACKLLAEKHPELKDQLGVVAFGNQSQQLQNMLPFKVYPLDFVSNEHQLVDIYNAVDLFVTSSLEENLPNTIMEAMSCGIPCVGFNVGGIPEMIDHLHNGYVAQYKSAEDFANGIYWILTEPEYTTLSEQACRKAVSNYSESAIAKRYIDVYNKITGRHA